MKHPEHPAVSFKQVTVQIRKHTILEDISIDLASGEITGILGPNGAGKTNFLSAIIGLRTLSHGTITVLGENVPPCSAALRQRVGIVFQETSLYDELTTVENLRFAASLYSIPEPAKRVDAVLSLLDLSARASQRVNTLSGGFRRRVAIARALLHSPDLLIIDEPTLGVDVEARHAIWAHLQLLKSTGTTIVVSTNYLDECLALCNSVAVLRAGKLVVSSTPEALVARAGSCLDIECSLESVKDLRRLLEGTEGILRIESTDAGLSIFLSGLISADQIVRTALQSATIQGFRTRGADLAEVFNALDALPK